MRKLFILLIALMGICVMGAAQNSDAKVQRNGNVFSSVKQNKAKVEPMATTFQWEDAKGIQYPIWVNPNSGRCFVLKTSKKTGNEYKYYLGEEVSKAVCKEMNITYVEKEG